MERKRTLESSPEPDHPPRTKHLPSPRRRMHRHRCIVARCLDAICPGDVVVNCKTPPAPPRRFVDGNERIEGTPRPREIYVRVSLLSGRLSRGCCRSRGNCLCPRGPAERCRYLMRRTIAPNLVYVPTPSPLTKHRSYEERPRKSPSRNCRAIMSLGIYDPSGSGSKSLQISLPMLFKMHLRLK